MSEAIDSDIPEIRARFAVQDFLVDLLGGLVPGLLFLLGLAFSVLPVIMFTLSAILDSPYLNFGSLAVRALEASKETPNTIWIAGFFVLLAIAYVVGHLFYRRGPRRPDQESFRRITKGLSGDAEKLRSEFGCSSYDECEFPYPFLDRYLQRRGHDHLLPFVRWEGGNSLRSKTYINLLKIRLRYFHPEKCSEVIKNEAHVRLSSSTWHVARAMRICSLVAIGVLLLALFRLPFLEGAASDAWIRSMLVALMMPASVLVLALFGKRQIENILHYQRMREVFFVLETSYIAFREQPEQLDPPFFKFVESVSGEMKTQSPDLNRTDTALSHSPAG